MYEIKRIQSLSPYVANQIAAGEVIERPASVIKELLENALDAKADTISIEVQTGGLNFIKVSDNGHGIMAEDLPLAIAAHATSKIRQLDDLTEIMSMGFRGEALASIASVSKLSLCSRTINEHHATLLHVEGAEISMSPCARNVGTTIEVRDLFFNTPVRKKFLKSERLEYLAIESVVKRFALSAPHIAIHFKHNDKNVWSLPKVVGKESQLARIARLMGKSFVNESTYLHVERSGIHLHGFISLPSYMRSQNDKQWIYVNQRMVKDKLLNHALKQAYEALSYPGRHPACLLYLNLAPREVDVNVHPTKHEVRFQQPRLVHDLMTSQLAKALAVSVSQPQKAKQKMPTLRSWQVPLPMQMSEESHWTVLNPQFVILNRQTEFYLVDIQRLKMLHKQSCLEQEKFPLTARPLLVPIYYAFQDENPIKLQEWVEVLKELGFNIEISSAGEFKILSIPTLFPALNIKEFLQSLSMLPKMEPSDLLQRMLSSQMHATLPLEAEELKELIQYAEHLFSLNQEPYIWCVRLDIKKCQELFDA